MSTKAIEVIGVSKRFGEIHAVDNVTLSVEKGELFGLIGHNGAGKSTLFKMMLGLLPLSSGDIRINGRSVLGRDFRDVRRSVGYLPENVVLYDNLTGLETLYFFADLKGVERSRCMAALARVGLKDAAGRRVRGYSKGMRQRLGFAQALLGNPAIVFLDEPTSGLDPEGIRQFYRILHDMRSEGATVILTSHILAEIQERVDRLAMMKSGTIQATGTVQSLREKMNLPVLVYVTPREGRLQTLLSGLEQHQIKAVEAEHGALVISCRRDQKMPVLDIVSSFSSEVADLQIREPSLEDVFLGYGASGKEYEHEREHSL